MRYSRYASVPRPSLFPFLAVLVCFIGSLMFMAVATAPESIENVKGNVVLDIKEITTTHGKEPIILECTSGMAQSLDVETTYSFSEKTEEDALGSDGWSGTPFTNFLNDICRSGRQEYILFVVRPDGLSVFRTFQSIILRRNEDKCINSVSISENPDKNKIESLTISLRRKFKYNEDSGSLTFTRVMSPEERDALKALFTQSASKEAVDLLFEKSQKATDWVDYGSELIPSDWKIQLERRKPRKQDEIDGSRYSTNAI